MTGTDTAQRSASPENPGSNSPFRRQASTNEPSAGAAATSAHLTHAGPLKTGAPKAVIAGLLLVGACLIGGGVLYVLASASSNRALLLSLFIPGAICMILGFGAGAHRSHRTWLNASANTLAGFGLSFIELARKDDPPTDGWLPFATLEDLKTGTRGVWWCGSGEIDGRAAHAVGHKYTVHRGKNSSTYYHTCFALQCPDHWPGVSLTPEHIGHKLMGLFGKDDLKVEDERFNKRWRITGDDEDFAILLLSPEVQELLRERDKALGGAAAWHIGNGWIRLVVDGRGKATAIAAGLERVRRIASLVPPELEAYRC